MKFWCLIIICSMLISGHNLLMGQNQINSGKGQILSNSGKPTLNYKRVRAKLKTGEWINLRDAMISNGIVSGLQKYQGGVKTYGSIKVSDIRSLKGSNSNSKWIGAGVGGGIGYLSTYLVAGPAMASAGYNSAAVYSVGFILAVPLGALGYAIGSQVYRNWTVHYSEFFTKSNKRILPQSSNIFSFSIPLDW